MAKIYGLFGSMTGKLAETVMSVRNGEQIARKYQPIVYNPSTPAQIAQRAKLKLLSQLSAVMAPFIAIRKEGSVSSRNLFTKVNFPAATFANDQADIVLTLVKLTRSVVSLPEISAERTESGTNVYVRNQDGTDLRINRVVYCQFVKNSDGSLRPAGSVIATQPSENNIWNGTLPATSEETVIFAYGVRDNTEAARVTFGDMQAMTAETVAKLVVSRNLTESDITLTETKAFVLVAPNA